MTFRIEWSLSDSEWNKAIARRQAEPPGSDYDDFDGGRFDLLYSDNVQFRANGDVLFPPDRLMEGVKRRWVAFASWGQDLGPMPDISELTGTTFSLVDLSRQLASILSEEGFEAAPDGTMAVYDESDDSGMIYFTKSGGNVLIRSSGTTFSDIELRVPEIEFYQGVRAFLTEFVREVDRRAPALLEWESWAPLRAYRE